MVRQHKVTSEDEVWALAAQKEREGDRGLMAFLMDAMSVEGLMAKALRAVRAESQLARSRLTRIQILEKTVAQQSCSCTPPQRWLELAKATLQRNGLDGQFQRLVYGALSHGRRKKNNIFLLGPPDSGKSFLIYPLKVIYDVYEMPDGGNYQLESLIGKELVFLNDFELFQ